ncbi:MAG TPA: hypothetical protein VNS55_13705 [Nocardioides sp.]|nr:hypothetical protein [Nocardioides sp.]
MTTELVRDPELVELLDRLRTTGAPTGSGAPAVGDDRLRALLARAAEGDLEAFLAFYDATCAVVWRLERCRHRDRAQAEHATCERYVTAWRRAGRQPATGLSPRAWLLSVATERDPQQPVDDAVEVCP